MYKEYFDQRLQKVTQFDKIRLHKLFHICQYQILYVIVGLILGSSVNYLFPEYDEKKAYSDILKEVLLQAGLLGIFIFYIRKIVKLVPYVLSFDTDYIPYKNEYALPEFNGFIIISLIFVSTQMKLLKKIRHLSIENNTVITNFMQALENLYNNIFSNTKKNTEHKGESGKSRIIPNNPNLNRMHENKHIHNINQDFTPNSALSTTKGITTLTPQSSNNSQLNNIPFNATKNMNEYNDIISKKKEHFTNFNSQNNKNVNSQNNTKSDNIFSSPILFSDNGNNRQMNAFSNDGNFSYLGKMNQTPNISKTLNYSEILKNSY